MKFRTFSNVLAIAQYLGDTRCNGDNDDDDLVAKRGMSSKVSATSTITPANMKSWLCSQHELPRVSNAKRHSKSIRYHVASSLQLDIPSRCEFRLYCSLQYPSRLCGTLDEGDDDDDDDRIAPSRAKQSCVIAVGTMCGTSVSSPLRTATFRH